MGSTSWSSTSSAETGRRGRAPVMAVAAALRCSTFQARTEASTSISALAEAAGGRSRLPTWLWRSARSASRARTVTSAIPATTDASTASQLRASSLKPHLRQRHPMLVSFSRGNTHAGLVHTSPHSWSNRLEHAPLIIHIKINSHGFTPPADVLSLQPPRKPITSSR